MKTSAQQYIEAIGQRDSDRLKTLLRKEGNVCSEINVAMTFAAEKGYAEQLRIILDSGIGSPYHNDCHPLRVAAETGHVECVELLLPHSNIVARDHFSIRWAAYRKQTSTVECLAKEYLRIYGKMDDVFAIMEKDNTVLANHDAILMVKSIFEKLALKEKHGARATPSHRTV